jgi:hypothetical protein
MTFLKSQLSDKLCCFCGMVTVVIVKDEREGVLFGFISTFMDRFISRRNGSLFN